MVSFLARRTFAFYVLLLMVYVLSPPVAPGQPAEGGGGAGVRLDGRHADATPWLTLLTNAEICFIDGDGVGSYSPGESVFLRPQSGCTATNAGAGAIRLAAFNQLLAGERIRSGDPDGRVAARAFSPDAALFKYLDEDNDGRLSIGDAVYADTLAIPSGRIDVGDVRVTPYRDLAGGVHVQGGDADVGRSLAPVGTMSSGVVAYVDADGSNSFTTGDAMVLRSTPSTTAGPPRVGDLRLGGAPASSYGTWFQLGDPDAPARLRAATSAVLCHAGAAAGYRAGDTVVVRTVGGCSGVSRTGDQRLASAARLGERIAPGDADEGRTLRSIDALFSYRNLDGATGFGPGDALYLDVLGGSTVVDAGDVRLTPATGLAAASAVAPGDGDVGIAVAALGTAASRLGFVDANDNGLYDDDERLYLNADGGGTEDVEVGDVRLAADGEAAFFGSVVTTGTPEAVRRLTYWSFSICLADSDSDNVPDPGEAVYLNPGGCGSVALHAVRLVSSAGHAAGTQVGTGSEVGAGLVAPAVQLAYLDADGSATWSLDDTLYAHFGGSTKVTAGDVRLTPYAGLAAGTMVTGSDGDRDTTVVTITSGVSGASAYFDVDGSGTYTRGDGVYLAPATSQPLTASLGFVRLTRLDDPDQAPAMGGPDPGDDDGDAPPAGDEDDLRRALEQVEEQLRDGDGDGFSDVIERQRGTDPEDPNDFPGAGVKKRASPAPGFALLVAAALAGAVLGAHRPRRGT